jgi:hypothetical protein
MRLSLGVTEDLARPRKIELLTSGQITHYQRRPVFEGSFGAEAACGGFAPAPPGFSALMPLPMRALCQQTDERGMRSIPLDRSRPLSRRSGCFPALPCPPLSPGSFYCGGIRGASLRRVLKGLTLSPGEKWSSLKNHLSPGRYSAC